MPFLRPGIRKLLRLDDGREVDDEIALHLELRVNALVRQGLSRGDAEDEARRLFAASEATMQALRTTANARDSRMHFRERWDEVAQDCRYAARRLMREPLVTAFMLLTLSLGIGANVTAFSLVDRILLRGPEHVIAADELSRLYIRTDGPPLGDRTMAWIPYPIYAALREQVRGASAMGAYRVTDAMIGTGAEARTQRIGAADGAFFPLLGARPVLGRFFTPADEAEQSTPLAVLSEAVWRNDYGADPSVIGKTFAVGDVRHTIVGVAPAGFSGASLTRVDAWTLITPDAKRSNNWFVIVRRRPGIDVAAIAAEVEAVHRRTETTAQKWAREATLLAAPISYDETARPSLEGVLAGWLGAISVIILVITGTNLVNLQLARLARRQQELGVRVALGAGRARVLRLLTLEGALLAGCAGVGSLLVAQVTEPVLRRVLFVDAGWSATVVTWQVMLAVGVITLLSAIVIGLIPAWRAGSTALTAAVIGGARGNRSGSRLRPALTVVQAALSVLLLVGAGLFLRSLAEVRALDLGMDPDRVLVADVQFPKVPGYPFAPGAMEAQAVQDLARHRQLLEAVRREPGVEQAALAIGLPFLSSFGASMWVEGLDSIPQLPGGGPYIAAVSADYFATMGTSLRRGRVFTAQDREGSEPVVVVGETMAAKLWPGGDALARCITLFERTAPCARVVGIVADVHQSGLREEASLQYYVPIGQQRGFSGISLIMRATAGTPISWPALRSTIVRADPSAQAIDLKQLSGALDAEMRPLRLGILTFGWSGALALVVAALGLYSVMAYMVAWRTREIGIRMALGATEGAVARSVVGTSARLAAIGIALGLVFAYAGRRLVESHLFEVSGRDPLVFGGVALLMLGVALAAAWLPARHAARIRPTEAIRSE